MKKIILSVLLFSLFIFGSILVFRKNQVVQDSLYGKRIKKETLYLKEENEVIKNEKGEIVFDSRLDYNEPSYEKISFRGKINKEHHSEIYEYLKYFFMAFPKTTKETFSKEDIAIIVSLNSILTEPRSEAYVQDVANRYFGLNYYELPVGTYYVDVLNEPYTIMKKDGYYISSIIGKGVELEYFPFLTKIEENQNHYKIYYDYASDGSSIGGCYYENLSQEEKEACRIGEIVFDLVYNEEKDVLLVEKMQYIEK